MKEEIKKWLESFGANYQGEVRVVKKTEQGEIIFRFDADDPSCFDGFYYFRCAKGRTYNRVGRPSRFKIFRDLTPDLNMFVLFCENCGFRVHIRKGVLYR